MDTDKSLNSLVHAVVQGGPVGPQGIKPPALLVLDHADPAGQYAVIQKKLLGPAGPKVKEPLALMRSRQYVRFRAQPWTVNLWRGFPSQSCGLWGPPRTVDLWRECRV